MHAVAGLAMHVGLKIRDGRSVVGITAIESSCRATARRPLVVSRTYSFLAGLLLEVIRQRGLHQVAVGVLDGRRWEEGEGRCLLRAHYAAFVKVIAETHGRGSLQEVGANPLPWGLRRAKGVRSRRMDRPTTLVPTLVCGEQRTGNCESKAGDPHICQYDTHICRFPLKPWYLTCYLVSK